MMLRRCDRYLLRQMVGPFLLALAGLALFILLNLILRLSELMVDRGVQAAQLVRLLLLWMPELIAWAIPMAALFAVFLGLGRMEHDREIMALESIGVSLRRLLLPLLTAALLLSLVTFAVYNFAMPASKHAAQRTYREILFSQTLPRITANTFFTGPSDQYFYVRQYDADKGTVRDILIYDLSGRLFPQAESRITLLTAEVGEWQDETWTLFSGRAYGFSRQGTLLHTSTFEELVLPVGSTADQMWAQSKSPSEMGISELLERIRRARASGIAVSESVVELHQRFALPLSALLFVLVGGTVSLMFGSRNRSTGIIVGLLIIGMYQGTYFWMQAYGRRGALDPALAAWMPNLLFGLLGGLLFCWVDRLASRDMGNRLRSRLPFLALFVLLLAGIPARAQPLPVKLECETLHVSTDGREIRADGSVRIAWEGTMLYANSLALQRLDGPTWTLQADGDTFLDMGDFALRSDRIQADIVVLVDGIRTTSLAAEGFRGHSSFENSANERHTLYFRGSTGRVRFAENGTVDAVEIRHGELTTCDCCDRSFASQPYTIRAGRLLIYPDRMIVAFGLTGRIAGVSTLWLPVYVQPLEDTLASPLFPAVGRDALRGWFLKWNLPFFVSESVYGAVLFDYFSRFQELGGGLLLEIATKHQRTQLNLYAFPATVGDSKYRVSLDHSQTFTDAWTGSASVDYARSGDTSSLAYSGRLTGHLNGWTISMGGVRAWKEEDDVVTQQLPDVALTGPSVELGMITLRPRVQAGWIQEWTEGTLSSQASRWLGSLRAQLADVRVLNAVASCAASLSTVYYSGAQDRLRTSLTLDVPVRTDALTLTYEGVAVSGDSPFSFDQVKSRSSLKWTLRTSGAMQLEMQSGVNLIQGQFDPWIARITWGNPLQLRATITYDLMTSSPQEFSLQTDWTGPGASARVDMAYDALQGQWKPTKFEMNTRTSASKLVMAGSVQNGTLGSLQASIEILAPSGWGITASSSYRAADAGSLSFPRYSVFKDIGDCLRVGIERSGGAIWIYGSILAFPEAILRYAPEAARVQFGTLRGTIPTNEPRRFP